LNKHNSQIYLNNKYCFRGAEELISSHGIPQDLLDRIMIIKTKTYDKDACLEILKIRAQLENVKTNHEAISELASIADETTLRLIYLLIIII